MAIMMEISKNLENILDPAESERVTLTSQPLQSIPPCSDEDDGISEALRRDAEMDAYPGSILTYDDFKKAIAR